MTPEHAFRTLEEAIGVGLVPSASRGEVPRDEGGILDRRLPYCLAA
jgi:hypothetical protein